ncbi:MAG: PilZ domain-containing protein [Hydrogenovibrio sp.]
MQLFHAPATTTDRNAIIKGQTVTVHGRLKEISARGVAVESAKNASIGTRLEVLFELPALGEFNDLALFGHVRNSHNTENGFFLTIEFETLNQHETDIIEDFLDYKKRLKELGKQLHHKANNT